MGASFTSTGDAQIANIETVVMTATGTTLNLSNQTEGFTITGSSGVDTITGGSGADSISAGGGNDIINGARERYPAGRRGNTDTLQVAANFTSTSDAQIANIENVTLTAAATLNLSNQTEGFTITGSSGADTITGGWRRQHQRRRWQRHHQRCSERYPAGRRANTDTLQVSADFTSTGDTQIANIETVVMTATGTPLDLSNQTEGFTITGSSGADTITSGSGADSISAGGGNDIINGAQNDTLLDGGANTDTLQVAANFTSTGDTQIANIENVLLTSAVTLDLSNQTEDFTITGSSGADTITGGSGADSISTGGGNDIINGAQNDTLLDGGSQTDTLQVGANFTSSSNAQIANIENVTLTAAVTLDLTNQTEDFTITGSSGADIITSGSGADSISAGGGNDIINGAQNDTLLDGGGNTDTLQVAANFTSSSNAQIANIENVTLTAAVTLDLTNQTEDFTITGSSGADTITSGSGDDSISAGGGNDIINGAQNDTLLDGGANTDTLQVGADFTSSSNAQIANIENVTLTAAVTLDLSNQTEGFTITGSSGADTITGGSGADSISAGGGNDIINGAQNDTLLDGGANTDTLRVAASFTSTGDTQIANIETVVMTATGTTLNLSNQTEGFTITGSSGVDTITGGSGADSISAGGGNDIINGAQNDTLLDGGGNTDTLQVAANFTSTSNAQIANIENVTLTAAVTLNLTNQTEDFTITGSSGADTITSGSGDDSISAGGGNDIINGADNDALLDGGANTDTLQVGANFDDANNGQIANIENILLTAAVTLNLASQTEGFNINGSSGADIITGGSGADTINGQAGNDSLTGGGGADQFRLRTNSGTDTITDYADNTDKIGFLGGAGTGGVNFTNTTATANGAVLNASDFTSRTSIANIQSTDDNHVDVISTAQTSAQIAATTASANNLYVIVFNSTSGRGEIWFDSDWSNNTGADRIKVATLNNVTTLAGVTAITASDIVVYDSTLGPAGIAGEPINLALTEPSADHIGDITYTIAGIPAGWSLSEGIDNGNGTWMVQTSNPRSLTITTAAGFVGASVLAVTESWTNADGSTGIVTITDNVEAYAPGSPIFAVSSNDTLTGTGGNDLFVFAQPIGNDTIYNFDVAADQIDLIGFGGIASFADIQANTANDGNGNAVITLADGESITVVGVDAASLTASNFVLNQEPVTHNAGIMTIGDGAILPLGGTIDNTGTLALNSMGDQTSLEILAPGVTLQGGGHVTLSDSGENVIFGATADATLTNVDNTISGAGQLGNGQMTLINEAAGVIDGNATGHALVLDTGSNAVMNYGMIEATGGGALEIRSYVINAGILEVGAGSTMLIDNSVVNLGIIETSGTLDIFGTLSGTGVIKIDSGATLELGSASTATITFANDSATTGHLVLDDSDVFSGQIVGFAGDGTLANSDSIDLRDIDFSHLTTETYTETAPVPAGY